MAKLLVPISALLLGFWMIVTVVSIDHGWAAELTGVGDPEEFPPSGSRVERSSRRRLRR